MTLAGAAMCRPVSLLADVASGQAADTGTVADQPADHPRLFYNAASLERLRQLLTTNVAADADLKNRGEALMAAGLIPENWPFFPFLTIGCCPERASIPWTRWGITGGASALRAPAFAPWHCWAKTRAHRNGSRR
jgi:hypothetical protein